MLKGNQIIKLLDPRHTRLPFVAGLVLCCLIAMAPELLPALYGRPDAVWSPVRSMNYHIGDLYVYAAYAHKLISDGMPIYSPSAVELVGKPMVESLRFIPHLLASVPGLVFSDMRFVILAGYGLSAALIFSIPFFLANRLTENRWVAMGVGLAALFGTDRLWVNLPITATVSQGSLGSWLYQQLNWWFHDLWVMQWASILATTSFNEYDFYGSTFRYVTLSFAEPILLAFFTISVMVHLTGRRAWISAMALLAPAMAFSYPTHAVIAYMLLIGFAGLNLLRRDWLRLAAFAGVGISTLAFLFAIDYPALASRILSSSEILTNVFGEQSLALRGHGITFLATVAINKYVMTFVVMLLLSRKERTLRDIVLVVGSIGLLFSLVNLFDMPQVEGRLFGRGIDHIWMVMLAICLSHQLAKWSPAFETSSMRLEQLRWRSWKGGALAVSVALLIGLVVVPLWSFGRLGMIHIHDDSRYLPQANMDAYRWIASNIPANTPLAILDWEDINILPIYNKVALVLGNVGVDGRSPRDELERFVHTYKYLGRSREDLAVLVAAGPQANLAYDRRITWARPPFLDATAFESYQFMISVLYWPYIKRVDDITITTSDAEQAITPQFIQLVLKIYDEADPATFLQRYSVGAVVVNAEDPFTRHPDLALHEVFRNASRVIYLRQQLPFAQ